MTVMKTQGLSRNGRRSSTRGGFTLIELLVVIAIIALLIAILLPSLEAARRQAKQNTCLSRIKNIGTSSRVYEADDPQGWGIPVHPGQDTQPELDLFQCPGDDGPPRAGHCPDWVANSERSSYDHFGTSYAANVYMNS